MDGGLSGALSFTRHNGRKTCPAWGGDREGAIRGMIVVVVEGGGGSETHLLYSD